MNRRSDITSVAEFSTHLQSHLDGRKVTHRPLFVIRNGQTEAVVLSAAAYDELANEAALSRSLTLLDRSMEDVQAGRGQPLKDAVREIAQELGLTVDRLITGCSSLPRPVPRS